MIIDCHSHIASLEFFPEAFLTGWCDTIKRSLPDQMSEKQRTRLTELFMQLMDDPDCSKMIAEMDAAAISQSVLLVIDFGVAFKKHDADIELLHLQHKQLIERSDRFIAFSGIDPRRGQEGIDLFEKAVTRWGFKGLKLYPPCGYSPSDERLDPYYEICSALHLPVLIHTGPTTSALPFTFAHPMEVDGAAWRFPQVNFILGHAGAVYAEEAAMLAQYRPNIYLDLSGFQADVPDGTYKTTMKRFLAKGLGSRLLFGTDWPIHRFFGNQLKWVRAIQALHTEGYCSEYDLNRILYQNFNRMITKEVAHGTHV
ncbi:amidohydrolase family protein [Paenibacillus sp. KN14-4R]|uniref:amidohydrolase family protein n=1 Tax=Paenibacillus sp. KN14-4R TaxID=3445773 RepID=UPI003FA0C04D